MNFQFRHVPGKCLIQFIKEILMIDTYHLQQAQKKLKIQNLLLRTTMKRKFSSMRISYMNMIL